MARVGLFREIIRRHKTQSTGSYPWLILDLIRWNVGSCLSPWICSIWNASTESSPVWQIKELASTATQSSNVMHARSMTISSETRSVQIQLMSLSLKLTLNGNVEIGSTANCNWTWRIIPFSNIRKMKNVLIHAPRFLYNTNVHRIHNKQQKNGMSAHM